MPECPHSYFVRLEEAMTPSEPENFIRIQCVQCKDIFVVTLRAFEIETAYGTVKVTAK